MNAEEKVKDMCSEELNTIWECLKEYNPEDMYDLKTTMEEWAEIVYSEISKRGVR